MSPWDQAERSLAWGVATGLGRPGARRRALVFNVPATFSWRAPGGGSSAATFFVATCVLGVLLLQMRTRTAAAVVAGRGVGLLVLGDAHGEVVLTGLLPGAIRSAVRGPGTVVVPQEPRSTAQEDAGHLRDGADAR